MDEYLRLSLLPEVRDALARLSRLRLCILSNGTPKLPRAVVRNAGLETLFDHVISVDPLRIY